MSSSTRSTPNRPPPAGMLPRSRACASGWEFPNLVSMSGGHAGLELVRDLMRELGLVACQPRPWRPSTTRQGQAGPIPDLVNRDFCAAAPGEKMVADITYIPTWEAWLYLATVIDCATRK